MTLLVLLSRLYVQSLLERKPIQQRDNLHIHHHFIFSISYATCKPKEVKFIVSMLGILLGTLRYQAHGFFHHAKHQLIRNQFLVTSLNPDFWLYFSFMMGGIKPSWVQYEIIYTLPECLNFSHFHRGFLLPLIRLNIFIHIFHIIIINDKRK
jgi:hypothetical protein